jgi:DNA-binding beta-propeller fold protein YncE
MTLRRVGQQEYAMRSAIHMTLMAALIALITPSSAYPVELDGTLLVANRLPGAGSVSFIDLTLGAEVARLPVGPHVPHEVAVSPDGRWVLSSAYGTAERPGQELVVYDFVDVREVGRIDLGPNSRPHDLVFLPDSRRALATMEASDLLALVDVEALEVIRTYPTGGREGHMVRLSPDASRAYVTSRGADGTLSVIFLDEDRDPVVIRTGEGAEGLDVTRDGREIWIANRRADTISIVDADRLEVVATLPSHPYAGRLEISDDGLGLIPNGLQAEPAVQHLRIYDIASRELRADIELRDGKAQRGSFGILAHGSVAFLTDRFNGEILIVDLEDPERRRTLIEAHDIPDGMAWTPRRIRAFE